MLKTVKHNEERFENDLREARAENKPALTLAGIYSSLANYRLNQALAMQLTGDKEFDEFELFKQAVKKDIHKDVKSLFDLQYTIGMVSQETKYAPLRSLTYSNNPLTLLENLKEGSETLLKAAYGESAFQRNTVQTALTQEFFKIKEQLFEMTATLMERREQEIATLLKENPHGYNAEVTRQLKTALEASMLANQNLQTAMQEHGVGLKRA